MSDPLRGGREAPAGQNARRPRLSFAALVAVMNSIGTCWIFVLLVLINADIVGRTVLDAPVPGVTEIVGMTIVACVFLQLGHALENGRLTRSDIILRRLDGRPRLKLALEALYNLVGAALLAVLLVNIYPMFINAWTVDDYEGSAGGFTAPLWPVRLVIVIGSLVASAQCLLNVWGLARRMANGSDQNGNPS